MKGEVNEVVSELFVKITKSEKENVSRTMKQPPLTGEGIKAFA